MKPFFLRAYAALMRRSSTERAANEFDERAVVGDGTAGSFSAAPVRNDKGRK
jgi:hypothetical protein